MSIGSAYARVPGRGVHDSTKIREHMKFMLRDTIAASTRRAYEGKGLPDLQDYLVQACNWTREAVNSEAVFLSLPGDSEEYVVEVLAGFFYDLMFARGFSSQKIQLYARALGKRCFEAARPRITQLLASSELLLAIRNFGGKATPLAKQLARDLRKTKMMTEGMLKFLIKEGLFKGFNSVSVAAGDVAIGVLAVILQVTFGLRASNLVRTMSLDDQRKYAIEHEQDVELVSGGLRQVGSARRPDEHVLLARNVNFYCKLTARMLGDNPKLLNLTVTDNEKDDGFKWLDGFELSKYYRSNRPVRDL